MAIAACAAGNDLPGGAAEPRWAQRPEEAGRLPVGRVVSVTRLDAPNWISPLQPGGVDARGLAAPRVDSSVVIRDASRNSDVMFRHTIQLRGGAIQEVEVEYRFAADDCVAIRTVRTGKLSTLQLVSALSGSCDEPLTR
jgi:hypothetical protein